MNSNQKAVKIFEAAVKAVRPSQLLPQYVKLDHVTLKIGNRVWQRRTIGKLIVIAVGKAAAGMALAAESILGKAITYGLCITKHHHALDLQTLTIIEAAHPMPDENSVLAAKQVRQMLEDLAANDMVLLLLSGGASSLLADIPYGITLEEMRQLNSLLLNSGTSIQQINTVRKHISTLKAGQFAQAAQPAQVITLAISDVVGNDPTIIAGGLTVGDPSTFADAYGILHQYSLWEQMPHSIKNHIGKGLTAAIPETPKPGGPETTNSTHYIMANNSTAIKAAHFAAGQLGFHVAVFKENMEGDAGKIAQLLIRQFKDFRGNLPACFLLGGEPVLKVSGGGKGGRAQHFVLSALAEMVRGGGADMPYRLTILAAGTDGTDGPTDAAGAVGDMQTIRNADEANIRLSEYLESFNSYCFFERVGGLIKTGATQTNACDVVVLLVEEKE